MKPTAESEATSQSPEAILALLEQQLRQRKQHAKSRAARTSILAAGVLFIVIGAIGALFILQQMLRDAVPLRADSSVAASVEPGH